MPRAEAVRTGERANAGGRVDDRIIRLTEGRRSTELDCVVGRRNLVTK